MEHIFESKEFILPLTKDEVAEILKVARVTIDRLITAKKISYFKVGSSYRFTKENVEEYILSNTTSVKNPNGGENK